MTMDGAWEATDREGKAMKVPTLGDWAQVEGWETFTGTVCYQTTFVEVNVDSLPEFIDLGSVGDIAEVLINDERVGVRAWAPYILPLGKTCRAGANRLEIRVTNSMANRYDGKQLPSGLIGPVALRK